LSGVRCGRDQDWVRSFAFNTIQITLLKVLKLADAKTLNDFSFKLYEGWNFNSGNYLFTADTK